MRERGPEVWGADPSEEDPLSSCYTPLNHITFILEHRDSLVYGSGMFSLVEISLVACGGAIGASLRFLVGRFCEVTWETAKFPFATLFVNLLGCLLIGLIAGMTLRNDTSPLLRIFIVTGILGGFTTFSAFGLETIALIRGGHIAASLLYVTVSVVGGCAGTFVGLAMTEPPTPLS